MEEPKLYKRNGMYYVFAPAGGVETGWQMVYRAEEIWGPYEDRKVMSQGKTPVNGPHQVGWVELQNGQNWFIHFQKLQPFGRIVHLQPVTWIDGWPIIGIDQDNDGTGEPVAEFSKPETDTISPIKILQTSDDFDEHQYNLAWQWQANYFEHWYSLSENQGHLRLFAQYHNPQASIWLVPNIIAQKIPGPQFIATAKIDGTNIKREEKAGLVVMGRDYASLTLSFEYNGFVLRLAVCKNADKGYSEELKLTHLLQTGRVFLRTIYANDGKCQFAFSTDDKNYTKIGKAFNVREGKWIGAKVGLFALALHETGLKGYADFDWFRIE